LLSSQMTSSVSEEITPAAAGIGQPRKLFMLHFTSAAARQLNRASRIAPHTR
jgi:hypothetical protein